jgi:tetratricopeptide (TPR) repeat protein
MSARAQTGGLPKALTGGVLVLALLVLGLGGAVIAIKLRPQPIPTDSVHRELALWEAAVAKDPKSAVAHTGLGLAYANAGQTADAETEFEQAIQLDRTSWMAALQLGVLVKGTDPQRAIDLFTAAAKHAPDQERITPLIALGDLQLRLGHARAAAQAYRRSIAFNPFTFDAHYGLGRALEAQGATKAALKEYLQAKRFDPSDPDVADAIARVSG